MKNLILICAFYSQIGTSFTEANEDVFEDASIWLAGTEGLELEEHRDGKYHLKGRLHRASDVQKVRELLKKHPELENSAHLTQEARARISQELKRRMAQLAPGARLQQSGDQFIVVGTISPASLQALREYYPDVQTSASPVASRSESTILLEMVLVEVKKTALQKLGMRLGGSINLGSQFDFKFLPQPVGGVDLKTIDPIRAFLDMALQSGEAKIHAKQSIVVQNGREGEFQAGGEFPIKMISAHTSRVEYKKFGLFLKFTPYLEKPPLIHLVVHSQISDVDLGSQIDGLPMITNKELKTQIYAKLDEMTALGGMVRASQSQFRDEMPGLSSIPILGRLFQSEDFKRQKSEAYIFITAKKLENAWLPSPDL